MTHDAAEPGEPQPNRGAMPPLPPMAQPGQASETQASAAQAQQPQPSQRQPSTAAQGPQPQGAQQAQPQQSPSTQPHQPAQRQQDAQRQYGVPARGQSYGQPGQPGPIQPGQPQQGPSLSSQLGGTAATQPQHPGAAAYPRPAHPTAGQPGQAPASAAPAEPKRKRNRAVPWLVLGLPIMLVVGVIAGYLLATNYNSFDNRAVEDSVAQVLRNDYGLSDLRSVDCPNWIKVEQGQSFQCEFEYAGGTQTVTVTQGSQSGQLVVGAPE